MFNPLKNDALRHYINKTGNVRIHVTLRCVHVTILAAEKQ